MSFIEILAKYSNWLCDDGTDKCVTHSYTEIYTNMLSSLSGKDNVNILENGICSGAFLQVMSEFLPQAEIYGIDINLSVCKFGRENPKIHLYELDGTQQSTAETLNQKFDLIIDDASHDGHDQLKSLEIFIPYLKDDGVYIIEDINLDSYENLKDEFELFANNNNIKMVWLDLRHVKMRYDDVVAIFRKSQV